MLHGIIYATNAIHLNSMSDADFADQVRDFFGNGTQLQEMYITPKLLDSQNWTTWLKPRNGRAPMPTCSWTLTGSVAIREKAKSMAGHRGRRAKAFCVAQSQ